MLETLYPLRGMDSVEPQTRRSRLYLLACAQQACGRLPGVCRVIVQLAENIFGGASTNKELRDLVYPYAEALIHCRGEAEEINEIARALVSLGYAKMVDVWADSNIDNITWTGYSHIAYGPFDRKTPNFQRIPAGLHCAHLLREIFGNPLDRPPPFDPKWRTENVIQLAEYANTSNDFAVMPILADALQESGCERPDILSHLRADVAHCRWCWVIEAILNRS